jgi:indole-3-glycerol phosphate synthase
VPSATYLDEIVAAHRARAATDGRERHALFAQVDEAPAPRGFFDHLAGHEGLAVVAEIKRRSPSKGDIDPGLDPAAVAREYAAGGAACVSVLTDERFFGGSAQDLAAARGACSLPVLRKDFIVSEADVCDARVMGADAVLLIAGVLSDEELGRFHALVHELAMDALVEVHDEAELDRALASGAELVGVNQRDLATFEVDTGRAARLAVSIPPEVVAVAESGIGGAEDARALADAGYQAVLVGESLLRARNRRKAVSVLDGHAVAPRARVGARGRVGSRGR